jgi:hypothetical protein
MVKTSPVAELITTWLNTLVPQIYIRRETGSPVLWATGSHGLQISLSISIVVNVLGRVMMGKREMIVTA